MWAEKGTPAYYHGILAQKLFITETSLRRLVTCIDAFLDFEYADEYVCYG